MDILIKKVNHNDLEMIDFLTEENFKLFIETKGKAGSYYYETLKDYYKDLSNELIVKSLNDNCIVYGAYIEDKLIGCGFVEDDGYLNSLFVSNEYRNNGIGSQLLEKLIQNCSEFDIIKVNASLKAISLYKRFSFHETGVSNGRNIPMELERGHYGK